MRGLQAPVRTAMIAIIVATTAADVVGQVGAGELTGIVRDQAGAAVPGATITVTDVRTNVRRTVVSSGEGAYTVASLAPGRYRVDIELAGFRALRREGVHLATGERVRLDVELVVGDVREQITVTADAPILRAETASLGNVVDHEKVVQLPLNGRSFITLASLAPGVALPPNSQLPRINGGRPRTNEYLFDGISVLQPEPGQVAYFPVVDAIQEFKIESNSPPAEFGRFNGGVVNLTTKAGSNVFHGDGFEFFRNEALNARNFFSSTNPVKPEFRRNQFGGILGGPIHKDHTFFFLDYQSQRQTIGRTVVSTVPTLLQRQGMFTEAIGGGVPIIYDPSTIAATPSGAFARSPPARAGLGAAAARAESVFRHHSAVLVTRRSDHPAGAASEAVPGVHVRQSVSRECRHDCVPGSGGWLEAAVFPRLVVLGQLHAIETDRRRVFRVRRVDSDRSDRELPGRG